MANRYVHFSEKFTTALEFDGLPPIKGLVYDEHHIITSHKPQGTELKIDGEKVEWKIVPQKFGGHLVEKLIHVDKLLQKPEWKMASSDIKEGDDVRHYSTTHISAGSLITVPDNNYCIIALPVRSLEENKTCIGDPVFMNNDDLLGICVESVVLTVTTKDGDIESFDLWSLLVETIPV